MRIHAQCSAQRLAYHKYPVMPPACPASRDDGAFGSGKASDKASTVFLWSVSDRLLTITIKENRE